MNLPPTPEDYGRLGLTPASTLTKRIARDAFRALALRLHPDHGGDPATFALVREAYERVLDHLPERAPCPGCSGTRVVTVWSGFYSAKQTCPACRGSGYQEEMDR